MPRGDRTGPNGLGPMTGRQMGFCAGYNMPGYMNSGFGRGFGMRRGIGRGFGFRRMYLDEPAYEPTQYKEPTKEEFLKELETEKADLEKTIKELKKEKK